MVEITRKIEFDAGHRIPDHKSKCRNAHGHRYVLECTVTGSVIDEAGRSDDGMVVDFGDLKSIMMEVIGEPWDHAFLVSQYDSTMLNALDMLGSSHKTVLLSTVPTVENLVRIAHDTIANHLARMTSEIKLVRTRLYETPNCWADAP